MAYENGIVGVAAIFSVVFVWGRVVLSECLISCLIASLLVIWLDKNVWFSLGIFLSALIGVSRLLIFPSLSLR